MATKPLTDEAELHYKSRNKIGDEVVRAKKADKSLNDTRHSSYIETAEYLIEQIYIDGLHFYILYNRATGEITRAPGWQDSFGVTWLPYADEEVERKFIGLPSGTEEYGSDQELRDQISMFLYRWLDIPAQDIKFAVYNIMKSWVFQRFYTLNYLRALGDYGSGKSRYLDAVGRLHYKCIKTTGTVTPPALFRLMGKWGGSIILDEADLRQSDEKNDIIKIVNQGYERENPVIRCDPNDASKVEFFDVFGPKVLATRKLFEDKAVESRCFTSVMRSTTRKEIPPNLNETFYAEVQTLRNKLLLWRLRNYDKIDPNAGEKVDLGIAEPRLRQISTGFVAMFAHDDKELADFKLFLLDYQKELVEHRSSSWEGSIFRAIVELFISGNDEPTATELVQQSGIKDKHGEAINPRAISSIMKSLGFGTAKPKKKNGKTVKFYEVDASRLLDLAPRYLVDEDLLNDLRHRVTEVTVVSGMPPNGNLTVKVEPVTDREDANSNGNNGNSVTTALEYLRSKNAGQGLTIGYWQKQFSYITDEMVEHLKELGDIQELPAGWVRVV